LFFFLAEDLVFLLGRRSCVLPGLFKPSSALNVVFVGHTTYSTSSAGHTACYEYARSQVKN
jgi:hypothetical protein